jgi:hypothetical protein
MIELKVKISDNPEDSSYKPGSKRTFLSWKDARIYLMDKENMEPKDAEECLQLSWSKAVRNMTEETDVLIPELRDTVKMLFMYFRWYADSDGSISYYLKVDPDREVYVLTKDPMKGSSAIDWDNNKTLEENIRLAYIKLARKKDLDFIFSNSSEQDNSDSNFKVLPTVAQYWETLVKPIWECDTYFRLDKRPVSISVNPKEPTFFFFDDKTLVEGEHPSWDDWLLCMPIYARDVFKAWLYSVFDPENKGRQCVWLHDRGYSGKSSVIRAISEFLENKCVGAISHGSLSNQFGYSSVYGKRLVVYGDNKNPKLIHQEKVHSILGGDLVQVERKNADPFSAVTYAKMLITANIPPELELSARNELTRLIYIRLQDPPLRVMKKYCKLDENGDIEYQEGGVVPKFVGGKLDEELQAELPQFLSSCKTLYEEHCPNHQDIPLTDGLFREMSLWCASPEHLLVEQFVEENLELAVEDQCRKTELSASFIRFKKGKTNSFDFPRLISYLNAMYGLDQDYNEEGYRVIKGCSVSGNKSNYGNSTGKPAIGKNV